MESIPQTYNKHVYALLALAAKIDIPDKVIDVRIIKMTLPAATADLIHANPINEQDWRASITQNLIQPFLTLFERN